MKKLTSESVMNIVGPTCGFALVGLAIFMAATPLMPFVWVSTEAATDPARWMVEFPALCILWAWADTYLTSRYVKKYGCLPPDYLL